MKSRLIYVDENGKHKIDKENLQDQKTFDGLSALEKVEQVATLSNRVVNSSQQVGNVMATLMSIKPQEYVSWQTFITGIGIAFIAGVLVSPLLFGSRR
jgi:uncharacterized membrane protein YjjP (DUF1212 family)